MVNEKNKIKNLKDFLFVKIYIYFERISKTIIMRKIMRLYDCVRTTEHKHVEV